MDHLTPFFAHFARVAPLLNGVRAGSRGGVCGVKALKDGPSDKGVGSPWGCARILSNYIRAIMLSLQKMNRIC